MTEARKPSRRFCCHNICLFLSSHEQPFLFLLLQERQLEMVIFKRMIPGWGWRRLNWYHLMCGLLRQCHRSIEHWHGGSSRTLVGCLGLSLLLGLLLRLLHLHVIMRLGLLLRLLHRDLITLCHPLGCLLTHPPYNLLLEYLRIPSCGDTIPLKVFFCALHRSIIEFLKPRRWWRWRRWRRLMFLRSWILRIERSLHREYRCWVESESRQWGFSHVLIYIGAGQETVKVEVVELLRISQPIKF
jgi:hypothetical protein